LNSVDLNHQAADLHEYLVQKIGHDWRLSTWEKKYIARLRTYGFEKCIIAIDGFHSLKWWMDNKSQDAPDCIFRSDKSFERFLATGMTFLAQNDKARLEKMKREELASKHAEIRERLTRANASLTTRMHRALATLRDEINEHSWIAFIAPLLFVSYDHGKVIIFSENASWITEHYADRIAVALGAPVIITSEL
jgi:hypothetical protein